MEESGPGLARCVLLAHCLGKANALKECLVLKVDGVGLFKIQRALASVRGVEVERIGQLPVADGVPNLVECELDDVGMVSRPPLGMGKGGVELPYQLLVRRLSEAEERKTASISSRAWSASKSRCRCSEM
ncbi:unnamed protein product [Linum trigynum]|uniref:Uncharacterized protein n=1 Tax=Linum trigynum TaxID=586398 RepID=A0AAV2F8I9_9ROSI